MSLPELQDGTTESLPEFAVTGRGKAASLDDLARDSSETGSFLLWVQLLGSRRAGFNGLTRSHTVMALKERIGKHCGIDPSHLILVSDGRRLQDAETLAECGLARGSVVNTELDEGYALSLLEAPMPRRNVGLATLGFIAGGAASAIDARTCLGAAAAAQVRVEGEELTVAHERSRSSRRDVGRA